MQGYDPEWLLALDDTALAVIVLQALGHMPDAFGMITMLRQVLGRYCVDSENRLNEALARRFAHILRELNYEDEEKEREQATDDDGRRTSGSLWRRKKGLAPWRPKPHAP